MNRSATEVKQEFSEMLAIVQLNYEPSKNKKSILVGTNLEDDTHEVIMAILNMGQEHEKSLRLCVNNRTSPPTIVSLTLDGRDQTIITRPLLALIMCAVCNFSMETDEGRCQDCYPPVQLVETVEANALLELMDADDLREEILEKLNRADPDE